MTLSELDDNTPVRLKRYQSSKSPLERNEDVKVNEWDPDSVNNLRASNEILR